MDLYEIALIQPNVFNHINKRNPNIQRHIYAHYSKNHISNKLSFILIFLIIRSYVLMVSIFHLLTSLNNNYMIYLSRVEFIDNKNNYYTKIVRKKDMIFFLKKLNVVKSNCVSRDFIIHLSTSLNNDHE